MKLYISYVLALTVLCFSYGQGYSQNNQKKTLRITIAPLNLFDPISGVVQVGVQKRISQRIAVALDYGLRFNKLSFAIRNSDRKDYRYFKGKFEVKYFFRSMQQTSNTVKSSYVSFQSFYFPQHYRKYNGWIVRDSKTYQYTFSNIDRKATTFSVLVGKEITKERFSLDIYFGVGYRILTIQHQTQGLVEREKIEPKEPHFPPIDEKEGTFSRPHVAFGVKMGYNF